MKKEYKVFTFNLRVEAEVDGINHFRNRKGRILDTIKSYSPDLIGFQEANDNMRTWLKSELPALGYTVVGCGRLKDYRGESTPIAFKNSEFELVNLETRWLSGTPGVPGSTFKGDQSGCPRLMVAAELSPVSGENFVFLNTHLDHKGSTARLLGAIEVTQYLSDKGLPFVLTGDMNAWPDTAEIKAFTSFKTCGRPVIDATAALGGTFHAFGTREKMSKIDYIFTDMTCDAAKSFVLPDEPKEGIYISDHRPVCAFVEI
ncbi:MAG: endonuclease/exonuclease/phosphatase family protein [Clostridia bacterium]|nr:endonuclease/exonuclease/phosphatase family protein [Clostridia bacterium]